jgi:hypothetical protein
MVGIPNSEPDRSVEDVATLSGDPIVNEARRRLDRAQEWYSEANRKFLEDVKFAYADSDNGYQWPNNIRHSRDVDMRPCLTMNITRQHNLMIVNAMRKARAEARVIATGGGASAESAQAFRWLLKHCEYQSNAQDIYTMAMRFQVDGGRGYWRLTTEYAGPDTFDKEIFLRPIVDPLSVFIDPDCRQTDRSDAQWAILFDTVPRSEFRDAYPELKDLVGDQPLGTASTGGDWIPRDHIMLAEYFRRVVESDELLSFVHEGQRHTLRRSEMPSEIYEGLAADPLTKMRDINVEKIEWYLIAGDRVIDSTLWPGKYIPIVMIVGEETLVEGIWDCKGHTRAMKDAQRMFNYNASAQVEFGALQTKVPWIAPIEAIEDFRTFWDTANQINHSVLPYKSMNEAFPEKPIPPPLRPDPPQASPAYQQGMETAFNQMMMTSGQWQNQMGIQGNERTGEAIQGRLEQGDTATFHFSDNFAGGLRYTAKQFIDLVPHIYDTRRVKRILQDDGVEFDLVIDPSLRQPYFQELNHQNDVIKRVFNPAVGKYDVAADVGPSTSSRRKEIVDAFTLILTQNPGLTGVIGDILLKNIDAGGDDMQEAARRLRRLVPPQALGLGPTQQEQQMQEQIAALHEALSKSLQRAGMDRVKLAGKEGKEAIETYDAETRRMQALAQMLPEDAAGLQQMIEQLVQDALSTHLLPMAEQAAAAMMGEPAESKDEGTTPSLPPALGASQASDGEWYLADPTRRGRYLKVVPLAQQHKASGVVGNR